MSMPTKQEIIEKAHKNGFEDIGFTTADPFDDHKDFLLSRKEEYGWAESVGLDLINGIDPKTILPEAKTIIVLLDVYFREYFQTIM
jgi:epoxyqueuosine reductase